MLYTYNCVNVDVVKLLVSRCCIDSCLQNLMFVLKPFDVYICRHICQYGK